MRRTWGDGLKPLLYWPDRLMVNWVKKYYGQGKARWRWKRTSKWLHLQLGHLHINMRIKT